MLNKNNITGIILAGGKSSRMGSDKALLKINNTTFIEKIIDVMQPYVDEIIIISDNSNHDRFNIRREEDFIKDAGPLAGLLTGMYYAKHENILALSCDIPMISKKVIETLISQADDAFEVNQIESEGKTMPLIAIYKKSCWYPIYRLLQNGERRLRVAVENFKVKTILLNKEDKSLVTNINTKQQLTALKNAIKN